MICCARNSYFTLIFVTALMNILIPEIILYLEHHAKPIYVTKGEEYIPKSDFGIYSSGEWFHLLETIVINNMLSCQDNVSLQRDGYNLLSRLFALQCLSPDADSKLLHFIFQGILHLYFHIYYLALCLIYHQWCLIMRKGLIAADPKIQKFSIFILSGMLDRASNTSNSDDTKEKLKVWALFIKLYDCLDEFNSHIVEAFWGDTFEMLLLYSLTVRESSLGMENQVPSVCFKWMRCILSKAFSHSNPTVKRTCMESVRYSCLCFVFYFLMFHFRLSSH